MFSSILKIIKNNFFNFEQFLNFDGKLNAGALTEDFTWLPKKFFMLHLSWPLQKLAWYQTIYLYGCVVLFGFVYNFTAGTIFLIINRNNVNNLSDAFIDYIFHSYTANIYLSFHLQKNNLREVIHKTYLSIKQIEPHNYERIKLMYLRGRLFGLVFALLGFGAFILYMTRPAIHTKLHAGERILIYHSSYPYDEWRTPSYEIMYLFQSWSITIDLFIILGSENFFVPLIAFCACMFDCISEDLRKLDEKIIENFISSDRDELEIQPRNEFTIKEKLYQELKVIVHKHANLLILSKELKQFFSPVLFHNVLCQSLLLCVLCWQMQVRKNFEDQVRFLIFIVASLADLVIFGLLGTLIMTNSLNVADQIYKIHWYVMPKKFRSTIHFMIKRAQQPMCLHRSKFGQHSLMSVIPVLKATWTYLTLLNLMKAKNEVHQESSMNT